MASLITSLKYLGKINLIPILNGLNCININEESKGKIKKENFNTNNEIS